MASYLTANRRNLLPPATAAAMARLRPMKTALAALCLVFAVCVDGAIAEDAQSIDPSDVDVDVDVDLYLDLDTA